MRSLLLVICLFVGAFAQEDAKVEEKQEIDSLNTLVSQIPTLITELHGNYPAPSDEKEAAAQKAEETEQLRSMDHFLKQMHGMVLDLHGRHTRDLDDSEPENKSETAEEALQSIAKQSEKVSNLLSKYKTD